MSPKVDWRESVAKDLDQPTFKCTLPEAVLFRVRNNYFWLYLIILVTWWLKLFVHPTPAPSLSSLVARMGGGPVAGGIVLACVVIFYSALAVVLLTPMPLRAAGDEIKGIERELSHWKF